MAKRKTENLNAGQVADTCGVSRQTVQAWYNEGLARSPSAAQVMRFLAQRKGNSAKSDTARLIGAQAEKFELENAKRRGELVVVEYVETVFQGMVADISARLDAIGGRLANAFQGNEPGAVRATVRVETDAVRTGLAEYFGKLAQSAPAVDAPVDSGTPAATKKRRRVGRRKPAASGRKRGTGKVSKQPNAVPSPDSGGG